MKNNKNYNWWTDPANAEQVKAASWWEHPENKTTIEIPVSIVESEGQWIVGSNSDTETLLGKICTISSCGDTKEEAIKIYFELLRTMCDHERYERVKFQKWVPFRRGSWKRSGSRWFVIFGIHVYFRYGKNMQGGWYIPFTKLNILINNEWKYK